MKLLLLIICCVNAVFATAQHQDNSCSNREETERIRAEIKDIREKLVKSGKLKPLSAASPVTYNHAFIWPMIKAPNYFQPGFYYISQYVDLDGRRASDENDTSAIEDYNCGKRTYDTHDAIDIAIGPFGWKMMDENNVYAVAAEAGVIVKKHDGEVSRTCKKYHSATYAGNFIAIEHSDGVITYYKHMKMGTLTAKDTGDAVAAGEYLGVVGSSGNSTGPHLHFQTESPFGGTIDPFQNGGCNDNHAGLIASSLWANEEPYYNKKILSVFTLSGLWTDASCDTLGVTNATSEVVPYCNHFSANSPVFFSAAIRDMSTPTPVRLRIINPNGTTVYDNTFDYTQHYSRVIIPAQIFFPGTLTGTYKLLCTYNGNTEPHYFTVGCPASQTLSGIRGNNSGVISGGSVNSTETVLSTSSNVEYQAETYIQLNPGFTAVSGCDFTARIDACTIGSLRVSTAQQKPAGKKPKIANNSSKQ